MEKTLIEKLPVEKFLAVSNLSKKFYRTVSIGIIVAISSAVLFASLVLSLSLKSGIKGLCSRLGADLLVVPEGYEKGAENVLLFGEPNYFYMERSIIDLIRNVKGVEKVSPQFYLTSLSESCCDFPVQIIGFDSETDFVVQSWARNRLSKITHDSEMLFSGSNVSLTRGSIKFFGSEHKISSRLSKSGTGMDNAIFCDMKSLQKIFDDAKLKGFGFISDGDTESKISTVLVKISSDVSSDAVALRIKNAVSGIQVIVGDKFIKSFSGRISSFLAFFYSISVLVLLTSIFSLGLIFSISFNERRREFSILRVLGVSRTLLRRILLFESFIVGGGGSIAGIATAVLVVIPFNALISEKMSLPFSMCGIEVLLILAVAVFFICTIACVLASVNAAVRLSKTEPYGDVK
ncbi:MAG: ABC transporter permease [Treponema sp.]|nr:ABC transporter permease [Treponema sp.]